LLDDLPFGATLISPTYTLFFPAPVEPAVAAHVAFEI